MSLSAMLCALQLLCAIRSTCAAAVCNAIFVYQPQWCNKILECSQSSKADIVHQHKLSRLYQS